MGQFRAGAKTGVSVHFPQLGSSENQLPTLGIGACLGPSTAGRRRGCYLRSDLPYKRRALIKVRRAFAWIPNPAAKAARHLRSLFRKGLLDQRLDLPRSRLEVPAPPRPGKRCSDRAAIDHSDVSAPGQAVAQEAGTQSERLIGRNASIPHFRQFVYCMDEAQIRLQEFDDKWGAD